jgi:hypothetical protein
MLELVKFLENPYELQISSFQFLIFYNIIV